MDVYKAVHEMRAAGDFGLATEADIAEPVLAVKPGDIEADQRRSLLAQVFGRRAGRLADAQRNNVLRAIADVMTTAKFETLVEMLKMADDQLLKKLHARAKSKARLCDEGREDDSGDSKGMRGITVKDDVMDTYQRLSRQDLVSEGMIAQPVTDEEWECMGYKRRRIPSVDAEAVTERLFRARRPTSPPTDPRRSDDLPQLAQDIVPGLLAPLDA